MGCRSAGDQLNTLVIEPDRPVAGAFCAIASEVPAPVDENAFIKPHVPGDEQPQSSFAKTDTACGGSGPLARPASGSPPSLPKRSKAGTLPLAWLLL